MLLVYLPQGSTLEARNGKLYNGNAVVDYHYGYNFEGTLRIKSLAVDDTLVEFNQQVRFYSTVENAASAVTFNWYIDGVLSPGSSDDFSWNAPEAAGAYKILLEIHSGISS